MSDKMTSANTTTIKFEDADHSEDVQDRSEPSHSLSKRKRWWNVWKKWKEGDEDDWWFASTGIPLMAATLGPLANITSIAALVTSWRQTNYIDGNFVPDFDGIPFADPRWCYWINVASLITGFIGNLFLLLNFTQRIRYIIALPVTIIFWYISSAALIAITVCMNIYVPPNRPYEGYTQGFWYGIAAAAFYLLCSMLLMFNMLGYFLGHYPENFALSESQRTLILQTMAFFIWLGGGSAIFSKIERDAGEANWGFPDALYFCDVTILTVGFGDLVPTTDLARGLVFPFSVGGIITLALIVSSLYKAVRELGQEKVVQKHVQRMRSKALERTMTHSFDLRRREHEVHHLIRRHPVGYPRIGAPTEPRPYRTAMETGDSSALTPIKSLIPDSLKITRKPKLTILKEEKDRFEAMRQIQADTKKFKRWMALFWSVSTFSILWCVGAVVFWQSENAAQGMTYFQALYFCYISLLTIGYGDLSPKSNAGRCFFVVWSLVAVPTMTILVSDLGDTVVAKFKVWSDELADFTVLPKEGIWREFLEAHPWLLHWLQHRFESRAAAKRLKKGLATGPNTASRDPSSTSPLNPLDPALPFTDPSDPSADPTEEVDIALTRHPTILTLAAEAESDTLRAPTHASLSRRLALMIQKVALELRAENQKRYSYEEWVEFTRVIRLTTPGRLDADLGRAVSRVGSGEGVGASSGGSGGESKDENEEGLVNWDWIGDNSPMVSGVSESAWLLERLCESMVRLEKRKELVGGIAAGIGAGVGNADGLVKKDGGGESEKRPVMGRGDSSVPTRQDMARAEAERRG